MYRKHRNHDVAACVPFYTKIRQLELTIAGLAPTIAELRASSSGIAAQGT
jgi:hypothetical protein